MNFLSKISLTLGLLGIIIFSSFSGTIVNAANQYTSYFSSSRQKVLNTWIQNKIVSRKSTLSPAEYKTFISGLSTKLNNLLANTNLSSNHRNTYGYILSEVDAIKNTTSTSANPTCNSEQTLVNGVCQNLRHTCPDGSIVAINRQCAVMQNQSSLITTLVHSPDYPSLTRSIVTPATSYKEMLETVLNYKNPIDSSVQSWIYSVGCKDINTEYNKMYRNPNHLGNITVESQSQAHAFLKSKVIECTKGDTLAYGDGIYISTGDEGPKSATFAFTTNVFKDITPGNPSKGRIWVPAGTKITTKSSGYSPQSLVAFRWNAAPEGTAAAIKDILSIPNREVFHTKRGDDNTIGTGFGGLYLFVGFGHDALMDEDFMSGKATRLGMTCYDQESCGGNVFTPNTGFMRFTPKKSGWLYFDTLNFKTQTQQYMPKSHWVYQVNGGYITNFIVSLEFDIDLVKKTLAETQWDSNGEPK